MDATLKKIREALGHKTLEWTPTLWLDTGVPELNNVIGHADLGLPYGKIVEIHGLESHGKTAIAMALTAVAQMQGALAIWGNFENSFQPDWAAKRGIDTSKNFVLVEPYVGEFEEIIKGKKVISKPRLATGQELCAEIEQAATVYHKKYDRMVIVVDSLASILTEGEGDAGIEGQNMRSSLDLPMFLGKLLRRWVGLAQVYNALIICTNQMRLNPMQRFGSPWYTPGGNAPKFYCHIRTRVSKKSKIVNKGKQVGIQGIMTAIKNKSGGTEGGTVGYRIMRDGPLEFVPAKEIKIPEKENGDQA